MFRREDRKLAARLARALDGLETGDDEAGRLAAVLERAAEPARFDVADPQVEQALAQIRPRVRAEAPARRVPRIGLAFAVAAVAAAAVLVVTLVQLPGVDVQSKALAALGRPGTILSVEERVEPGTPGAFPPSTRVAWIDSKGGRVLWTQPAHGIPVEMMLLDHGRVSRYLYQRDLLVVGSSCRAFASGCADVVDPIAFYRNALLGRGAVESKEEELRGKPVYRLTLPVQTLPDAVRIEQRVTISAKTFLPRLIEWREQRPGEPERTAARIIVRSIQHLTPQEAGEVFVLPLSSETRVLERIAPGKTLRKVGERRLSLAQARRLAPRLLWLGRRFAGRRLTRIEEVRWNAGTAYRIRYRGVTVWNYTNVVPPELVPGRVGAPSKTVPGRNGVAHFYPSRQGELVAELERGARSAAVIAPGLYKEDVFHLIEALRPLR